MKYNKKIVLLSFALTISLGLNFKNAFNTTNITNSSISKKNEFVYDGRKYENATINNYIISSKGEISVTLSAIDQATGDSVRFTSPPTVVAKWGKAIWGKDKWN